MKLLLLCAGYGTRLEKDLKDCQIESLSNLNGLPKSLLPICGKPLISHWIDSVENIEVIDEVIVVTNNHFLDFFLDWKSKLETAKKVTLVNDGTKSNDDRLGAVADICLVIQKQNFENEDILIVAGDTLFFPDFGLEDFIEKFHKIQNVSSSSNLIVHCTCPEERVHLHGIIELGEPRLDGCDKVTSFLEKPKPEMTSSRMQSPCFYLLHHSSLPLVGRFLASTSHLPLSSRDATGNFLAYLIQQANVFSLKISGRFDVGNLKSYLECCHKMTSLKSNHLTQ